MVEGKTIMGEANHRICCLISDKCYSGGKGKETQYLKTCIEQQVKMLLIKTLKI